MCCMIEQKEELLNLSDSRGQAAVKALRADITALNMSLHNINTVSNTEHVPTQHQHCK